MDAHTTTDTEDTTMNTATLTAVIVRLPYGEAFEAIHHITSHITLEAIATAASEAACAAWDANDGDEFGRLAGIEEAALEAHRVRLALGR